VVSLVGHKYVETQAIQMVCPLTVKKQLTDYDMQNLKCSALKVSGETYHYFITRYRTM